LLKKSGFNVVNIHKKARTHHIRPTDLEENPNLALYLSIYVKCGWQCDATISLYNYSNELIYTSTGSSGFSGGGAFKNAMYSLTEYSYKYDEN
tara:strand:- start:123 stop:401 length:279 start_codon:yes stop_codon:yes gene_type:complete